MLLTQEQYASLPVVPMDDAPAAPSDPKPEPISESAPEPKPTLEALIKSGKMPLPLEVREVLRTNSGPVIRSLLDEADQLHQRLRSAREELDAARVQLKDAVEALNAKAPC